MTSVTQGARKRILSGGPLRLLGQAVSLVFSLFTTGLVLRYLGPNQAGLLYSGLAALALAGAASELGMTGSGVRDYIRLSPEQQPRFVNELAGLRLALLLPACLVASLTTAATGASSELLIGTACGSTWMIIQVLFSSATVPLSAQLRNGTLASLQIIQAISGLLCTWLLVSVHGPTWLFFGTQVPGLLLSLCIANRTDPRHTLVIPKPFAREMVRLNSAARTLGLATLLGIAYYRSGPLLVQIFSGREEAGLFGASFRLLDVVESIAPLLLAVALPVLSVESPERVVFDRRMREVLIVMTILGGATTTLLIVLSAELFKVLAGPEFSGAVAPLQLMAGGLLAAAVGQTYGYGLLARRAHASMLAATAIALSTTVLLSVILVPSHGAVGGAVALVAGQVSLTVAYGTAFARSLGAPTHASVPLRGALCTAVATIGGLIVSGPPIAAGAFAMILLAVSLALTGLLRPRTIRLMFKA